MSMVDQSSSSLIWRFLVVVQGPHGVRVSLGYGSPDDSIVFVNPFGAKEYPLNMDQLVKGWTGKYDGLSFELYGPGKHDAILLQHGYNAADLQELHHRNHQIKLEGLQSVVPPAVLDRLLPLLNQERVAEILFPDGQPPLRENIRRDAPLAPLERDIWIRIIRHSGAYFYGVWAPEGEDFSGPNFYNVLRAEFQATQDDWKTIEAELRQTNPVESLGEGFWDYALWLQARILFGPEAMRTDWDRIYSFERRFIELADFREADLLELAIPSNILYYFAARRYPDKFQQIMTNYGWREHFFRLFLVIGPRYAMERLFNQSLVPQEQSPGYIEPDLFLALYKQLISVLDAADVAPEPCPECGTVYGAGTPGRGFFNYGQDLLLRRVCFCNVCDKFFYRAGESYMKPGPNDPPMEYGVGKPEGCLEYKCGDEIDVIPVPGDYLERTSLIDPAGKVVWETERAVQAFKCEYCERPYRQLKVPPFFHSALFQQGEEVERFTDPFDRNSLCY